MTAPSSQPPISRQKLQEHSLVQQFQSASSYGLSRLQKVEASTQLSETAWSWFPWIGFVAGIGVLGQLYAEASQASAPFLFERFWLGMFLFYLPTFWRLLSTRTSRPERIALLVATAFFSYLPKLLRCPYYFCYSDELTWWRGIQNILGGGDLLATNPF